MDHCGFPSWANEISSTVGAQWNSTFGACRIKMEKWVVISNFGVISVPNPMFRLKRHVFYLAEVCGKYLWNCSDCRTSAEQFQTCRLKGHDIGSSGSVRLLKSLVSRLFSGTAQWHDEFITSYRTVWVITWLSDALWHSYKSCSKKSERQILMKSVHWSNYSSDSVSPV